MAIVIQDPETDRLARELSAATGETVDEAVQTALRERLESMPAVPRRRSKAEIVASVERITAELAKLPVLDDRTPDEIIGYNGHGHFD